ncbi:MAG: phosphoribosylaminoimidazolesuccinocarboxamide synthase [Candidatus Latescibacteria bacterium]|nr:phosphoribosylaminoimidazolesuccinocarboxamide synthase [Candidatus Latescibacterota bacterium]MDP7238733.1 phosphoribosylaminoimidazolesuccinocarboxamide synthase [Candidatus Latescibacterota bacterium]
MQMLSDDVIKAQMGNLLDKTDFDWGGKYEGKVRDNYVVDGKRVIITTDRISAFDRVLCAIPFKGQVLNQTAAFWFEQTRHIVPNHVLSVPDPNVLVAKECVLIPVEMVVRGYLTGVTTTSAWYSYKRGIRNFCGHVLPEGMEKNQPFDAPILTPSTKAEKGGHDESVSSDEIIKRGLVDERIYREMERIALALYRFGNQKVAEDNLILVDTKYEFGLFDNELMLIDEIHTPDSSRFWIKETYDGLFSQGEEPQKLDKEYIRQWLAGQGFIGEGDIPVIPDDIKIEAARKYITAYEMITGQQFKSKTWKIQERIRQNLQGLI